MNIDVYKKYVARERVPEETDLRILSLLEEARTNETQVALGAHRRFRLQSFKKVAVLVLVFLMATFATATVSGKVLYDDWFGLFRSLEGEVTEGVATSDWSESNWNSKYGQLVGQTLVKDKYDVTLEKVYFDGLVLMSAYTLETNDDTALLPESAPNLEEFNWVSILVSQYLKNEYDMSLMGEGGGSRSFIVDKLNNGKAVKLLNVTLYGKPLPQIEKLTFALSEVRFEDSEVGTYSLFANEFIHTSDETTEHSENYSENLFSIPLTFETPINNDYERINRDFDNGITISYSDLSCQIEIDATLTALPNWFIKYPDPSKPHKNLSSWGAPADLNVKLHFTDNSERDVKLNANFLRRLIGDEETAFTNAAGEEAGNFTARQEGAMVVFAFPEIIDAEKLVSIEIEGEVYKLK